MASKAFLSSKIVINEEPPQIRSITARPTAVLGMVGITQRGPFGPRFVTSNDEFRALYGGYTAESRETVAAVEGYFEEGGQFLWFTRVVHYTDITDDTTATSAAGDVDISTGALAAAGAAILSGEVGPFNLAPGQTLIFDIGAGNDTATFDAAAPVRDAAAGPYNLTTGDTLTVRVQGGPVQTVTFSTGDPLIANIAALTAAEAAAVINRDTVGVLATNQAGTLRLSTDGQGTGFSINVTGGTANAVFTFTTGSLSGTGDVSNIDAVSAEEAAALIAADIAGTTVTVVGNRVRVATTATGASTEVTLTGGTAAAAFDFPTEQANGNDAASATASVTVAGKTHGSYTDDITVRISDAQSGEAERFNLEVLVEGVSRELFPNLSMSDTDSNYVETIVNADGGSQLIAATDLDAFGAAATAAVQRPANGTYSLTGGDDGLLSLSDSDFVGDEDEKTGMYALDGDTALPITLLCVPARITAVVQNAMLTYCEVWRTGSVFAILDSPSGLSASGMLAYVRTQALLEDASEFGAIYYPHVRVINPNTTLFGSASYIEVPPSGHIAGVFARTDTSSPGGVYRSPAGQENGRLRSIVGFEILPGRQQPETFDETKRDLLYPARVNPLDAEGGLRIIDGGRTLSGSGNFPNVGERRGVIFIEQSIKAGLQFARHRNNDDALRAECDRICEKFLLDQMTLGAFRTRNPATAFFIDFGRGLNTDARIFQGVLVGRIGLATNKPAEFIELNFTQDTRALQQELSL